MILLYLLQSSNTDLLQFIWTTSHLYLDSTHSSASVPGCLCIYICRDITWSFIWRFWDKDYLDFLKNSKSVVKNCRKKYCFDNVLLLTTFITTSPDVVQPPASPIAHRPAQLWLRHHSLCLPLAATSHQSAPQQQLESNCAGAAGIEYGI